MFALFDYLYTMGTVHPGPVMLGRLLTNLQIALACFLQFDSRIWPRDTVLGKAMTVMSVASVLCPPTVSARSFIIVNFIFTALVMLLYFSLFVSCILFVKHAKVNSVLVNFVSAVFAALTPWILNVFSALFARCIYHIAKNEARAGAIVAMILNLAWLALVLYLYLFFITNALAFRPQVFHIVNWKWSAVHLAAMVGVMFLSTVGGIFQSNWALFLDFIPGAAVFYLTTRQHLWGDIDQLVWTQSLAFLCGLLSIVLPTMVILKTGYYDILVFVFAVLYFFFAMIFEKINRKIVDNTLEALERFEENANVSTLKEIPYQQLMNMLRIGFENGSHVCHTWKLFELAFEVYPDDADIIIAFARYAAIYPDESWALHVASRKLASVKRGNIAVKNLLFQTKALIQHRDRALSKTLQRSLIKIQQKIERCRGQMKYAWECVMRDNIKELEGLAATVKTAEDEIMREYDQLCVAFPTSAHVASSFATFLADIVHDDERAHSFRKRSQSLRVGGRAKFERTYFNALTHMPNLPNEDDHFRISKRDRPRLPDSSSVADTTLRSDPSFSEGPQKELTNQRMYLESTVRAVRLPAMKYGPFIMAFFICVAIPVASIPGMVLVTRQMEMGKDSIRIIGMGAQLHLAVSHVLYYTFQYVFSANGIVPTLKERFYNVYDPSKPQFEGKLPNYFLEDDRVALIQWIKSVSDDDNIMRAVLSDVIIMSQYSDPRRILFGNNSFLREEQGPSSVSELQITFQHLVAYLIAISTQIANCDPGEMLEYPGLWTILRNSEIIMRYGDSFLDALILSTEQFLKDREKDYMTIILNMYAALILIAILVVAIIALRLEKEKNVVYNSFRALPKSAVAAVIEFFNSYSGKEHTSREHLDNNPRENALRVLSARGDNHFGWIAKGGKVLLLGILYAAAILAIIYQQAEFLHSRTNVITEMVPLYADLLRIHIKYMISLVLLQLTSLSGVPEVSGTFTADYEALLNRTIDLLQRAIIDSYNLRFGNSNLGSSGISLVGDELSVLLSRTSHDPTQVFVPEVDIEILDRSSYDTGTQFLNRMFNQMIVQIRTGDNGSAKYDYFPITAPEFDLAGVWLLDTSYSGYAVDALLIMNETVDEMVHTYISSYLTIPFICLLLFLIIVGIAIVPMFIKTSEIAQWIPHLLLFCDPGVVLQSKPILKVLSNDFSSPETDENDERANFYEVIAGNMPFGVVLLCNRLLIQSINTAVENIVGKRADSLLGMDMKELFHPAPGKEKKLLMFYQALEGALNKLRSPEIEADVEIVRDGTVVSLSLAIHSLSIIGELQTAPTNREGMAILVLVMRDMTSIVHAREALEVENHRNEDLLAMVYPSPIVKRILSGEKDIKFSAPSVTVAFLDIVNFTPWCERHDPSFILGVLNRLYRHLDNALQLYPKLIKLRVMCERYVCVGGVFDEVTQHEEHAKQVLAFCIDAIETFRAVNRDHGESLAVKIGCNTGGPVIAGVVGGSQSCFDVVGPVVNIAKLMAETGVSDNIHVPDSVYQTIFDQGFVIKVHGDIMKDDRILHTYLVSGYTQPVS